MIKQAECKLPTILSRTRLGEGRESKFKRRNNDLVDRLNQLDRQANILTRLIQKNLEPDRILLVKEIIEIVGKIKIDLIDSFTALEQEKSDRSWNGSSVSGSSRVSSISSELSIASNESSVLKEEEIPKVHLEYKNQIEAFVNSINYENISVKDMRSLEQEASYLLRMTCLNFAKHARNDSNEKNKYREYVFELADIAILLNKHILERMRMEDDIEDLRIELVELERKKLEIIAEENIERDEFLEEEQTFFGRMQQKEIIDHEEQDRLWLQKQKITDYRPFYQYSHDIELNLIVEQENQSRIQLNKQHLAWYHSIYEEKQNIQFEANRRAEKLRREQEVGETNLLKSNQAKKPISSIYDC